MAERNSSFCRREVKTKGGCEMRRVKLTALLAVLCLVMTAGTAFAADFPTKPITFLIGWSTGGGSDLVSRVLCGEAEKHLGQPIVIVNKPGGSGAKSYMEIYQARPDGYTIGNTTGTISTHKHLGNIPVGYEGFKPVMTFNYDPGAIWVKEDAPWQTLEEFVQSARENPDSITVAASNPGSITRFGLLLLEEEAGVKFRIASQAGGESAGPGLVAGGHVDACQAAPVTGRSLYEAGKIRPLGVMSEERLDAFPEIPTYKEQGYDITIANYRQIIAPKRTPDEVINVLYDAFKKAAEGEKYQKYMHESGSVPLSLSPEESLELMRDQSKFFMKMIMDMGMYKGEK
jgi:tripartite-type tricarboxylate transporter receptor subunit TctC